MEQRLLRRFLRSNFTLLDHCRPLETLQTPSVEKPEASRDIGAICEEVKAGLELWKQMDKGSLSAEELEELKLMC